MDDYLYDQEIDPFDRYTIVQPYVQRHKRSVFIPNLEKVANSLQVPKVYLIKAIAIAAKCQYSVYQGSNFLIKAPLSQDIVREYVKDFSQEFLTCKRCKLLEAVIRTDKKQEKIYTQCAACGEIKRFQNENQMVQFILNNKPEQKKREDIFSFTERNQDLYGDDDDDGDDNDEEKEIEEDIQEENTLN